MQLRMISSTKKLCSSYHLTTCMHINKTDDQRGILLITHHWNGECSHLLLHNRIFSVQLVAELSKCPVLEKDQRFLPQGTFLQSSRQATKAHHILQDVSFSLLGLWRLLTFPSFWSYFPWWFYGFTTILKTLGWIKHQNSVRLFARFLHPRAFKTFHNDNKWWMVGSSNYTPKKTNSLKLEFWKPCLQMCFSKTIE